MKSTLKMNDIFIVHRKHVFARGKFSGFVRAHSREMRKMRQDFFDHLQSMREEKDV